MPEQVKIRMPMKSDRDAISEVLHLSDQQAAALWRAVEQIVSDIKIHQSSRLKELDGRSRKAWLRNTIKTFDKLCFHLSKPSNSTTNHLLRSTILPRLGALLSHDGMERLIRSPIGITLSRRQLDERMFRERELDPAEIDRLTISDRSNVAVQAGPQLLQNLVVELARPLRRQLDLEKADKGGAPGRKHRNYVIKQLVGVHEQLHGKSPTSTPRGPFAIVCELVLASIGFDEKGLDSAISRVLANTGHTRASS